MPNSYLVSHNAVIASRLFTPSKLAILVKKVYFSALILENINVKKYNMRIFIVKIFDRYTLSTFFVLYFEIA